MAPVTAPTAIGAVLFMSSSTNILPQRYILSSRIVACNLLTGMLLWTMRVGGMNAESADHRHGIPL